MLRLIVGTFAGVLTAAPAAGQSRPTSQPSTQAATAPTTRTASQPVPQRRRLTIADLFGPEPVDFDGSYARGMRWLADGVHYLHRRDGRLMRVSALTDEAEPAYDQQALEAALRAHPDFSPAQARRLARRPTLWCEDRSAVLIRHGGRLYFYRFAEGRLRRLSAEPIPQRALQLSPHGEFVSFVREGDLYVIDTRTARSFRLTRDGGVSRLNGILDWVYQEEIYGRGRWAAHWWRDDAKYLAYLQLDESAVPVYTILDYLPHVSRAERTHYPKAGDPNPAVRLAVVRLRSRRTVWVDLSRYAGQGILIVRVGWAPDGALLFCVQDREQRWLELNEADPRTGRSRCLLRESSPAWVDDLGPPHWLADGSFLWLSERDGWRHVYHYSRAGRLLGRLTRGDWMVHGIIGADPQSGWVYLTGARESPFERHAYRVPLAGGAPERLTEAGYTHAVNFDPTLRYFFDTFSSVVTPTRVYLRRSDGTLLRVISDNQVPALDEYLWSMPELHRIPNRRGFPLNVWLLRPPDFDPARRYPVWCEVYGGPRAQTVWNHWGGSRGLYAQYLAQQGYLVLRCDPHQASGAGAVSAWQGYCRLGVSELADIEDALNWLGAQGCVDTTRIGIGGYSYGGYATAYALTHSRMFRLGIAGAPLSDWRNYDSVYAERYMRTPERNPDGYERSSVLKAADRLHGRLLIVHGLRDDNVHFQNTAQLIDRLQQQPVMFDLMVYPQDRHGLSRGGRHYRELRLSYILENL